MRVLQLAISLGDKGQKPLLEQGAMSEQNPYAPPEADIEVHTEAEFQLAGRWARLGGSFVDGLIMMAIVLPAAFGLGYWETMKTGEQPLGQAVTLALISFAAFLLINGYILATRGQSVGKIVAGTRIVSASDNRIISLGKLVGLRLLPVWIVNYVPIIGPLIVLVDTLFIFRKDRRCIHDWIAGTRVVVA